MSLITITISLSPNVINHKNNFFDFKCSQLQLQWHHRSAQIVLPREWKHFYRHFLPPIIASCCAENTMLSKLVNLPQSNVWAAIIGINLRYLTKFRLWIEAFLNNCLDKVSTFRQTEPQKNFEHRSIFSVQQNLFIIVYIILSLSIASIFNATSAKCLLTWEQCFQWPPTIYYPPFFPLLLLPALISKSNGKEKRVVPSLEGSIWFGSPCSLVCLCSLVLLYSYSSRGLVKAGREPDFLATDTLSGASFPSSLVLPSSPKEGRNEWMWWCFRLALKCMFSF